MNIYVRFNIYIFNVEHPRGIGKSESFIFNYAKRFIMPILEKLTDRTYLENTLNKNTLGETLGIEITEVGEEYLEGRMPVDHRTKQPFGLLHGGASVALAETLASVVGFLSLSEGKNLVGVEINANHLRAVREGYVVEEQLPSGLEEPCRFGKSRLSMKRSVSYVCQE